MKTLTHELSGYRIVRRIPLASDKDYVLLCAASTGGKKLVAWTLGEPHPPNLPISLLGRNRLTAVAGDGTRFTPRIDSMMSRYIHPAEPVYQVQPPRPVCGRTAYTSAAIT